MMFLDHFNSINEMTRKEKLKAIEDMGINVSEYCPTDFNIGKMTHLNCGAIHISECENCFIKALED